MSVTRQRQEALAKKISDSAHEALQRVGVRISAEDLTRIADIVIEQCVVISEPVYSEVPPEPGLVKLYPEEPNEIFGSSRMEGGICVKPGNMMLDTGKLVRFIRSVAKGTIEMVAAPLTIPFVALELWDSLSSMLRIELTEIDAAVFWVMVLACNEQQIVEELDLLGKVNIQLESNGRPPVQRLELDGVLGKLDNIGCIRRTATDKWQVRESVELHYYH